MRIALVTISFLPKIGGAEFVIHNLASAWSRQGHEVCVLNPVTDSPSHDAEYTVRKFYLPPSYLKFAPHRFPFSKCVGRSLKRHLQEFRPDFISAHFGYPLGVWLSKIQPTPRFLITCHGSELTKFAWGDRHIYRMDKVLSEALNKSAGAVAISRHARELMEELGVRPEKILDIPNGVDVRRFQKKVNFDLRESLGIPQDSTVVLSVGREHCQKAYDVGIRAFADVAGKNREALYIILGRGTRKWQGLVDELQLQDRVILHEGLSGDNLVGAYQQADIFFSPSAWEMMPLVVLEAMAAGLPLVVTNISGSQDMVETGHNGIVIEPDHTDDMADAILNLAEDRTLRERMRLANLSLAESYSWDRISRAYLDHSGTK
jgi:glycosyltransferase involved in cell wall biosynthesis